MYRGLLTAVVVASMAFAACAMAQQPNRQPEISRLAAERAQQTPKGPVESNPGVLQILRSR